MTSTDDIRDQIHHNVPAPNPRSSGGPWTKARAVGATVTFGALALGAGAVWGIDHDTTVTLKPVSSGGGISTTTSARPEATTATAVQTASPSRPDTSHAAAPGAAMDATRVVCDGWITRVTTASNHKMTVHDSTNGGEPSGEDCAGARTFYDEVVAGTTRFGDIRVAYREGYAMNKRSSEKPGVLHHFFKRGGVRAVLDTNHPEGLVYYINPTTSAATLIGVVFKEPISPSMPQPGGSLTTWHDHHDPSLCAPGDIACGSGAPAMLHVWTFAKAVDPFGMGFANAVGPQADRGANRDIAGLLSVP